MECAPSFLRAPTVERCRTIEHPDHLASVSTAEKFYGIDPRTVSAEPGCSLAPPGSTSE